MTLENNEKLDYGRETVLDVKKKQTRKVIEVVFSSPFDSKENKDILKEVTQRSYHLLYEQPQSPNPTTWSNSDVKKFMTFSNSPSTKPNDVGTEKGIPNQTFEKQGAPAATYFPSLNSPGVVSQLSGDISDAPNVNINPADTVKVQPEDIKTSYYVMSPSETSVALGKSSLINALSPGMSQYSYSNRYSPEFIDKIAIVDITKNNFKY